MDKIKTLTEDEVKQYDHLKRKHTVYLITNLKNSKIYVGVHSTKNAMDDYMGSGKHIKMAIEKHGIENFKKEIIAIFDNRKDALELEKEIVNKVFLKSREVYNIAEGGGNFADRTGIRHTEETKAKISRAKKNKPLSPEHCEKIRVSHLGHKHSPETKRKMSESQKGKIISPEAIEKTRQKLIGRKLSPEHRKAISDGQKKIVWLKNEELDDYKKAFPNTAKFFKLLDEGYVLGNKKPSAETREKIGQAQIGTHKSEETKNKIREKMLARGNLQTGIVWLKNEILGKNAKAFPNTEKYERLIAEGWEPGRIISEETKKKMSLAHLKAA